MAMAAITAIEPISFSLIALKSSASQAGWSSGCVSSNGVDEALPAGQHHDQHQVGHQRQIDQAEHGEHCVVA